MDLKFEDQGDGLIHAKFVDVEGFDICGIGEIKYKRKRILAVGCYPKTAWLDRKMCSAIWPLIKRFAETGKLSEQP